MPAIPAAFASEFEEGGEYDDESFDPDNSHPANFDTFVPRHDPSLSDAKNGADEEAGRDTTGAWRGMVPPPPAAPVTSSEAFERAMGAWFWAGYWTGVYHVSYTLLVIPQLNTARTNPHFTEWCEERASET